MKRTTTTLSNLATLLCLAASACGQSPGMAVGGGDCPNGGSEFQLNVSGPSAAEACGRAVSGEGSGGDDWGVQLLSTTDITQINIWTHSSGRPATGTYHIVDHTAVDASPPGGDYVMLAFFDEASLGITLTSVSGTLTILSSSADQVSGTFEISAREGTEGAAEFTMAGSFTAENEDA